MKIWITTYWNKEIEPMVSPFDNKEAAETCAKYYKHKGYNVCIDECEVFHSCIWKPMGIVDKVGKE